ncbi:hypothetical protein ABE073_04270 [Lederbergia citrisecunda]|uniref:hypothetical protein n=1 Tax=Lederbergia citrisecunda TaxID=2833583 RepID=UPI003D2A290E
MKTFREFLNFIEDENLPDETIVKVTYEKVDTELDFIILGNGFCATNNKDHHERNKHVQHSFENVGDVKRFINFKNDRNNSNYDMYSFVTRTRNYPYADIALNMDRHYMTGFGIKDVYLKNDQLTIEIAVNSIHVPRRGRKSI